MRFFDMFSFMTQRPHRRLCVFATICVMCNVWCVVEGVKEDASDQEDSKRL